MLEKNINFVYLHRNVQIVDKTTIPFIISRKQFTPIVHIPFTTGAQRNEQEKSQ
jgi:hypothetical protein